MHFNTGLGCSAVEEEGVGKKEMLSEVGGWGVSECSGRAIFIFLLKKTGFVP